ncbi:MULTISPECIES: LuxR C-terminal-related transcriptional regulator [unclassified Sphingomonas]|uniref:LuxR C-terminal-related transcriptional regulator n=1 Tax=unclassified Sphingomonas TaxID=196159 RepID=UPI0006FA05AF|nr:MULTISPECIES: LuxR C-terminal-related transcriptional regulator [unclassified Sphingomonas]KQX19442.1 hypothetical protein ASD17_12985 [Sphingomonas sp. Root1294]KQY65643.1 hypothetical protein ASD39_16185 [Sphingomonas sp. Root50]KRB95053.1 hypothetical protein ASE22_03870 [Sphingomonas sp. Root720]
MKQAVICTTKADQTPQDAVVAAALLRVTPPLGRPDFIARPPLDQAFDAARWTALVAPPGYGKTQQALHWLHRARQTSTAVTWINGGPDLGWDHVQAALAAEARMPDILFIDDCDALLAGHGAVALRDLLRTLPPAARLVTTGHAPVPADLVLTADELRLDDADALALFRGLDPNAVPDEAVGMALRDGWAPAINIAATAVACGDSAERALLTPDGPLARHWARWLADPDLTGFVGCLTILERGDADVAAVASGRADAGERIAHARRTIPFFRGSAVTELARHHLAPPPAELRRLHRRVADWLVARARDVDAVPHLIACERSDEACAVLDRTLLSLIAGGDLQRVLGWLDAIDPALVAGRPSLSLAAALAFSTSGDRAQADRYLRYHSSDDRYVLEMLLATHADDPDGVHRLSRLIRARDDLSPMSRMFLRNCEKMVLQKQGRWPAADAEVAPQPPSGESLRMFQAYSYALCRQAMWHLQQGRALRCADLLTPALAHADAAFGRASIPSMLFAMTLAGACMQRGDLAGARQVLVGRRTKMESHIVPGVWSIGVIVLAQLAVARGDAEEGLATLMQMEARARERDTPAIKALAIAERVQLEIALGRMPSAVDRERLAQLYAAAGSVPINGPHIRLEALKGLARIAQVEGQARKADDLLREGERLAAKLERRLDGLEFALLRDASAGASAYPDIDAADAAQLRRRLAADDGEGADAASGVPVALTAREREVLALLERHLSNKVIARALDLGAETVKWHVANLLAKLGASDRVHAIERARALGLLHFRFAEAPL